MCKVKTVIALLLFFMAIGSPQLLAIGSSSEPFLATGFIYPVMGPEAFDIRQNVNNFIVSMTSQECTSSGSEKWYYDGNGFGNNYCPKALSCPGPDCFHPGEDWNHCPRGTNETGTAVYSVANGRVVRQRPLNNTDGSYVVIKHILPSSRNTADYVLNETAPPADDTNTPEKDESRFDVVYSAYLHIDPSVAENDIVKKGDRIGTIHYIQGLTHLHFDMRTEGILAANMTCGYASFLQGVTDNHYIEPSSFIRDNLQDLRAIRVPSIQGDDFGRVSILGREGFFTNTQGSVVMKVCNDEDLNSCVDTHPDIIAWRDTAIIIDIFSVSQLDIKSFTQPVLLTVIRSDNTKVGDLYYPFQDVKPHEWYSRYVAELWKAGVVKGKGETGFYAPTDNTTRAEFVKLAANASGKWCSSSCDCGFLDNLFGWKNCDDYEKYCVECNSEPPYDDMADQRTNASNRAWYYDPVKLAYNAGWIVYDADHKNFEPEDSIVRAEVAKILTKAKDLTDFSEPAVHFKDVEKQAPEQWFYKPVYLCKENRIFEGYYAGVEACPKEDGCDLSNDADKNRSCFCPLKKINRSEVAKVIDKAFLE